MIGERADDDRAVRPNLRDQEALAFHDPWRCAAIHICCGQGEPIAFRPSLPGAGAPGRDGLALRIDQPHAHLPDAVARRAGGQGHRRRRCAWLRWHTDQSRRASSSCEVRARSHVIASPVPNTPCFTGKNKDRRRPRRARRAASCSAAEPVADDVLHRHRAGGVDEQAQAVAAAQHGERGGGGAEHGHILVRAARRGRSSARPRSPRPGPRTRR